MGRTVRMIGRRVRLVRERLAYSVEGFAAEIDLPPDVLRKVEEGEVEIGAASLAEVARLSGRPLEFFITGRGGAAESGA